jgi:hypothetical protein
MIELNTTAQKKEVNEPQNTNSKQKEVKVISMVSVRHMKTYGEVDFKKILIDHGIRHCPPQSDGLLF